MMRKSKTIPTKNVQLAHLLVSGINYILDQGGRLVKVKADLNFIELVFDGVEE